MNDTLSNSTKAIAVSDLNKQVKSLLESSFLSLRVTGEISNFARPSSGHWYFTLKDDKAQIKCAMFRGNNQRVKRLPKEGDQVIVTGKVSLYEGRGDYQMICNAMEQDGQGQLQQLFEQLKTKLQAQGLFDAERKQAIPKHPSSIGVITSPTGAAIHDILTVLKRRFPGLPVRLYPTAVQGMDAADNIVSAIDLANRENKADVLIVGRGGGSLEDLWPFNEERVAMAIVHSKLPIVSAVGHEVDLSISDMVADLRAPTPSAAAELLSPDGQALSAKLSQSERALMQRLNWQLDLKHRSLHHLTQRLRHPGDRIREQAQRCDEFEIRLKQSMHRLTHDRRQLFEAYQARLVQLNPQRHIEQSKHRVEVLFKQLNQTLRNGLEHRSLELAQKAGRLNAVSPLATLERGYALATDETGAVIRDSQQVQVNDRITLTLQSGKLTASVTNTDDSIEHQE